MYGPDLSNPDFYKKGKVSFSHFLLKIEYPFFLYFLPDNTLAVL